PAHPSYNSGHSGISAASAAVLASFFGSDAVPFSLSSDGLPGVTRSYASFSAAVQEVSDSRVYAGIHWRIDVQARRGMGSGVGDYLVPHVLRPAPRCDDRGGAAAVASGPAAGVAVTPPIQVPQVAPAGVIQVSPPPAATTYGWLIDLAPTSGGSLTTLGRQ